MLEAVLLGVALAMDSMAVSIVNGIRYHNYDKKQMLAASFSFGFFQGLMPMLGYLVFYPFLTYIEKVDHWLVLLVLSYIGIGMICEGIKKEEVEESSDDFTFKILLSESIATSIDALSTGIVLPTLSLSPWLTCVIIGVCTFIICIIAHCLGKKIAILLKDKAAIVGGVILIMLGIKTVIEHLGLL